jgi:hypothetical protein
MDFAFDGMYIVQYITLFQAEIGDGASRVWYISSGIGPSLASHWLEDCANCMPMLEENDKYSANHS